MSSGDWGTLEDMAGPVDGFFIEEDSASPELISDGVSEVPLNEICMGIPARYWGKGNT